MTYQASHIEWVVPLKKMSNCKKRVDDGQSRTIKVTLGIPTNTLNDDYCRQAVVALVGLSSSAILKISGVTCMEMLSTLLSRSPVEMESPVLLRTTFS